MIVNLVNQGYMGADEKNVWRPFLAGVYPETTRTLEGIEKLNLE